MELQEVESVVHPNGLVFSVLRGVLEALEESFDGCQGLLEQVGHQHQVVGLLPW